MKAYFGYIRVSTAKQGEGVSLVEQKAAIERHAVRAGLSISEWFEERETAAKRGRPVFSRMLARLRSGRAVGVIIHKIDRSARNLKDWADLGELIDAGIDVHFAADGLDLSSRGGRLSADIQAVVAADYIRNLREETKKGFYGRLKQGFYPLGAPLGYLDQGGGKAKAPDPTTAPFVRMTFELYATGNYTLHTLRDELLRRGFRRPNGGRLHVSTLSHLLNNPFYTGIIRIKKTGESYRGIHEPLIARKTYDRVQEVLKGKLVLRRVEHDFFFRRLFICGLCNRSLIGERQKGHVYYRCHTKDCATTGVREEDLQSGVHMLLRAIQLTPDEVQVARSYLSECQVGLTQEDIESNLSLAVANTKARLDRLTDAFVDGLLEKPLFEQRRSGLVVELARLESEQAGVSDYLERKFAAMSCTLELVEDLVLGYEMANVAERREILKTITSNRTVCGKELAITPQKPFAVLANRVLFQPGAPIRKTSRTAVLCQRRQKAVHRFVDEMLEDPESHSKKAA